MVYVIGVFNESYKKLGFVKSCSGRTFFSTQDLSEAKRFNSKSMAVEMANELDQQADRQGVYLIVEQIK